MELLPVVLSGGSGTRLWPISREKYPKQLLPLVGEQSMLQATVARLDGIEGLLEPWSSATRSIVSWLPSSSLARQGPTIVLEPFGRNTAPALTLAALWADERQVRTRC